MRVCVCMCVGDNSACQSSAFRTDRRNKERCRTGFFLVGTCGAGDEAVRMQALANPVLPGRCPPDLLLQMQQVSECHDPAQSGPVQWLGRDTPVCRGPEGFHLRAKIQAMTALYFLWAFCQQVSSCWAKLGFLGALSQGFPPVPNGPDSPAPRMSPFVLARPAT